MATHKLFYRGDFDNDKAEAPNGAVVNKAYLDFITGGGWAETKTIKVRPPSYCLI